MSMCGFGYDEEVPGGFQDADMEMAEFEERARERQESVDDWDSFAARVAATAGSEVYA